MVREIWESDSMLWFYAVTRFDKDDKSALEIAKDLEKQIEIALQKIKKEFRLLLGVKETDNRKE